MRERRGYKKDFFLPIPGGEWKEKEKERRDREERKEGSILQQQISTKRKRGKNAASLSVFGGENEGCQDSKMMRDARSFPSFFKCDGGASLWEFWGRRRGIKFHFSARHGAVCTIWERDAADAAAEEEEGGGG